MRHLEHDRNRPRLWTTCTWSAPVHRRGCFQINLTCRGGRAPRTRDSTAEAIDLGRGVRDLVASVRQADDRVLLACPTISWHEPTAVDSDHAPAGSAVVRLQVPVVALHPTGDAGDEIAAGYGWTGVGGRLFADRVIAQAAEHVGGREHIGVGWPPLSISHSTKEEHGGH